MNAHERLRRKLDLFPAGMPDCPETAELLRLLFSEDDAALAARVPNFPITQPAPRIAARAGVPAEDAARGLRDMADRGLILEYIILGTPRYALMPAMPGFIEMQFIEPAAMDGAARRRAGELWHQAMRGDYGREVFDFPTSSMRVIPVNKTIGARQTVYSFEEAEKVLRASGRISLAQCACRSSSAHPCDGPRDTCLMLNAGSDYVGGRMGLARRITFKQALDTLERGAQAGLVHMTTNNRPPVQVLCSCCACCCTGLISVTRLGRPAAGIASNFRASPRPGAACAACGACEKICPTGAISAPRKPAPRKRPRADSNPAAAQGKQKAAASSARTTAPLPIPPADAQNHDSGVVDAVDAARCLGCGLCVRACPHNALALLRKSRNAPAPTTAHLWLRMFRERGKLDRSLMALARDLIT